MEENMFMKGDFYTISDMDLGPKTGLLRSGTNLEEGMMIASSCRAGTLRHSFT